MVARKQYTKEFKLDAISLVLDQGYSDRSIPESGNQCQYAKKVDEGISEG